MSYGARDVTVRFGSMTALDSVTVEVEPGAVVAVVGGDGAGKSTLLRAVVGEVRVDSGTISAPGPSSIGYLPAGAGSWGGLTVTQNLDFAGGVYGLVGERLADRREALLHRAALEDARDRPASQLSGGMRRKLGFTMAAAHEPPLLVLDEPSTGVDPVSRMELWRLVTEAAASGAAVLLSTTYLDEAERAAHLVVLDQGRVLVEGDVDAVLASLPGTVVEVGTPTRLERSWRRGRVRHEYVPDGDATAGATVRPDLEDVVIALSIAGREGAL